MPVFLIIALILPLSILVAVAQTTGGLTWWESNYKNYYVASASTTTGGGAGAKLNNLYVYADSNYLYLAVDTNNTASWNVAYGLLLDVIPGGYNNTAVSAQGVRDAWGRNITVNGLKYGVDYEIYFWYDQNNGITTAKICTWNTSATISSSSNFWDYWIYTDVTSQRGTLYDYTATTGSSGTGLQVLWVAIPWSTLGISQQPGSFYVLAVLTGGDNSGSVDSIPYDPTVTYGWTPSTTQVYNTMYQYSAPTPVPIPEPLTVTLLIAGVAGAFTFYTLRRKNH
jgi:hypothetical protein